MTWPALSLAAAALLLVVIPVRIPGRRALHRLEVIATGERNAAARGSEVWIESLRLADGRRLTASELSMDEGWEVRYDLPASYRNQPATLRWEGVLDGDAEIRLTSHPWSGIARILWDGVEERVELYSPSRRQKAIRLRAERAPVGPIASQVSAALRVAPRLLALWLLLLFAGRWLATRPIAARPALRDAFPGSRTRSLWPGPGASSSPSSGPGS